MRNKLLVSFLFLFYFHSAFTIGAVATWNFKLDSSLYFELIQIDPPRFTSYTGYESDMICTTYSTRAGHQDGLQRIYLTADETATISCESADYLDVHYDDFIRLTGIVPMKKWDGDNFNLTLYPNFDPWMNNPDGRFYGGNFLIMQSTYKSKGLYLTQF